jgi:hypothetical protein
MLFFKVLPPSQNRSRYGMHAGQTFSALIRFVENAYNIYISKLIYYESIFNDLSNNTNYVL